MRKAISSLGVLLLAVALSSCAVVPPGTTSPSPQVSATSADAGPSGLEASGNVPELLDASYLDGLLVGVASVSTSASSNVFVSWPQFGRTVIDQTIGEYFKGLATDFEKTYTSDNAEINVGWHLIAASPNTVGIISDGYLFAGTDSGSFWKSIWFDPTTDVALSNADLVKLPAANTALAAAASQQSADLDGFNLSQIGADPAGAAPLVAFSRTGELLFGYDECRIAACSAGRITVTIDLATTTSLLTAKGLQAQAASMKPSAAVSANTPSPASPSVTATPSGATVNCAKAKCIALTFDDGPGPYTTKLLGYLSARKAPATFFMLGQQVDIYPKVAKQVAVGGNQIGVHTWSHRQLTRLNAAEIDSELSSTVQIIVKETGVTPTVMRPPYGSTNATVSARAKAAGLAIVLWNVDTLDWKTRNTEKTVAAALADSRRGSIILLHDIHKTSVEAVPGIVDGLRAKGYTFVTVDQLLGKTTAGKTYRHG
jgi:peptidoglycan-N-acetylglucosamine deacetylase